MRTALIFFLLAGCGGRDAMRQVGHEKRSVTVSVEGHPLAVHTAVPPNATHHVVLVHGRTWSGLPDFDLQVPGERLSLMDELAVRGIASYAVDLRGYGKTPRDASGWLSPQKAVGDVHAVVRWIQSSTGQRPALFGWSMGALVSHLYAQRHGAHVTHLILYGYPIPVGKKLRDDPGQTVPARTPNTAEAARSDFITPGSISPKAVDEYVRASLEADPVRVDWRRVEQFDELNPSKVDVATLIIHGDRDPLAKRSEQEKLLTLLGAARKRLLTLPGTDHAAHLEIMPPFVEALVTHLTGQR